MLVCLSWFFNGVTLFGNFKMGRFNDNFLFPSFIFFLCSLFFFFYDIITSKMNCFEEFSIWENILWSDIKVEVIWMGCCVLWNTFVKLLLFSYPSLLLNVWNSQIIHFIRWGMLWVMIVRKSSSQYMFKAIIGEPFWFIFFFRLHFNLVLIN